MPNEDQGRMMVEVHIPVNSSPDRTGAVHQQVQDNLKEEEGELIQHVLTVNGFNFAGRGQNSGLGLVMLKGWDQRAAEGQD
ncbi:efflux RND transporter permease subunit, partial [Pseudomonas sp. FIP_A4]|uniref:efflux RND transporter permease subunit n=1 Tax=Pseudomonas sp. FIP_A4 TaxID=3070684 RepID=UPI002FD509D8